MMGGYSAIWAYPVQASARDGVFDDNRILLLVPHIRVYFPSPRIYAFPFFPGLDSRGRSMCAGERERHSTMVKRAEEEKWSLANVGQSPRLWRKHVYLHGVVSHVRYRGWRMLVLGRYRRAKTRFYWTRTHSVYSVRGVQVRIHTLVAWSKKLGFPATWKSPA
ncbi:hypothetical protein LX36DRAFT_115994 [Colletotrichum falcatum]|nr:hypothetical protein LX36DRAFT_115994 [Colletotrichum falcatum]